MGYAPRVLLLHFQVERQSCLNGVLLVHCAKQHERLIVFAQHESCLCFYVVVVVELFHQLRLPSLRLWVCHAVIFIEFSQFGCLLYCVVKSSESVNKFYLQSVLSQPNVSLGNLVILL